MNKNDKGLGELLELLRTHPDLMSAIVFDPPAIKRLLKSKAARRLVMGVDVRDFLRYVAGPEDGGPIAVCLRGTAVLCPKRTRYAVLCFSGTKPVPSGTKPYPPGRKPS
jgi:hypothetical protein